MEFDTVEEICRIHNKGFSEWINSLGILYGYKTVTKSDVEQWMAPDNSRILVAYENNTPIGYLHYQIIKMKGEIREITCLEIIETTEGRGQSRITVIPEKRRIGVAEKLLRHVLTFTREHNVDVIIVYAYNKNQTINRILNKLGFIHKRIMYYPAFSSKIPIAHDTILAEFDLSKEIPVLLYKDEINIREFQYTDLEDLRQIFVECRSDMLKNLSEREIGNYWIEDNWAEKTFVAEFHGEVVGCMEYNKDGLIGIPGVKKKHQKKGVASQLLIHLLRDMKSKAYSKALADTGVVLSNAIKLYRKLQFNISRELWAWVKTF